MKVGVVSGLLPAVNEYRNVLSLPLSCSYQVNCIHDSQETAAVISPSIHFILNNTTKNI